MANQIILKKSSVAAKAPAAADLEYGELALNYSDGKLYYKKSDNSIDSFTAGVGSGGSSSTLTIQNKTAAYTVVAGDNGTIINCSGGAFTINLTAAATLGAGFSCWVWNTNTDANAITIDPNASETIDFIPTLVLRQGEGLQIVCDGTNWHTGSKKAMRGYADNIYPTNNTRPIASAWNTIAIGYSSDASTTNSMAVGHGCKAANEGFSAGMGSITAVGIRGTALGYNSKATGDYAVALGSINTLGSIAAGNNSMSVGGSYASGESSFAAAVANNTTAYGATQANSIAIGYYAKCGGNAGLALGYLTNVGGSYSVGIGYGATTTAAYSIAISADYSSKASARGGVAIGTNALAATVGKYAYSGSYFYGEGSAQTGTYVLSAETSTAQTTARLRTNTALADSTNQIILPNNSAYAFTGTVVARQQTASGTQTGAWQIKGLIRREGTAGSTTLVTSILEVISYPSSTWTVSMAADTTNGGLAINVTSLSSAGNIRWVATVQTTEVIYA